MIGNTEAARSWYATWADKPATGTALKLLNALGGTNKHLAITRYRIECACFNAAHYDQKTDPGQIYRTDVAAERKRLVQLAKAARVLRLSAGRNEKGLMWACDFAEEKSGVRITRANKTGPKAHHLVVEEYFHALEDALKGKLPELHGKGPWLHKYTAGNMILPETIGAGPPITTETMLAFELAFYLRMHTAGRAEDGIQNGQPMPADGDPCYAVVAAFCSATLPDTPFDGRGVSDKVQHHAQKHVGLQGWPSPG